MWNFAREVAALHCNTLHHTAPHCSTLQHTATHRNTLQHLLLLLLCRHGDHVRGFLRANSLRERFRLRLLQRGRLLHRWLLQSS